MNNTQLPFINSTTAYSYETAQRHMMAKTYGEMTVGLVVTMIVAIFTQITGMMERFLQVTGWLGMIGLCIVQILLVGYLSIRVMKMQPKTARLIFYAYAILTGFTLSTIFSVYTLGSIGLILALSVGFFFVLTMLALTTKVNVLKFGTILFVGVIVLVIGQLLLMWLAPSDGMMRLLAGIGVIIFAGLTAYDAQKTRQLIAQADSEITLQRISILCSLSLYLDFINLFLMLLRLIGVKVDR